MKVTPSAATIHPRQRSQIMAARRPTGSFRHGAQAANRAARSSMTGSSTTTTPTSATTGGDCFSDRCRMNCSSVNDREKLKSMRTVPCTNGSTIVAA